MIVQFMEFNGGTPPRHEMAGIHIPPVVNFGAGDALRVVAGNTVELADVDREVCPGDTIQFFQAEAFEVFRVGWGSGRFSGASERRFAA
jgi:hypothetical protein